MHKSLLCDGVASVAGVWYQTCMIAI